ncbi:hypothetical protein R3W88_033314 [Solanum pinnatisectum]|uniref:Ty3-gypsy retrotransposon protein n=1 Tax=Solanum pinnatisectum TaxID=50273 RepID=A0AAV9K398_9SOLN|nr:hypothetical protein R3W88_033314 [Solanum pinnatisectum]
MAFKKINDVSCKDYIVATLVDFSDVDPITRREFKTSFLNGSEYFTSLEMPRKSKSQMTLKTAIPGGNIASKLFDELSHSSFNFAQYGGPPQSSLGYSKPYSKRIEGLLMPIEYQPPKFQQFDGRGNPRQHIAHFVETCSSAGTHGDLLVKQFIRSLKENAFDWYTNLEPESID